MNALAEKSFLAMHVSSVLEHGWNAEAKGRTFAGDACSPYFSPVFFNNVFHQIEAYSKPLYFLDGLTLASEKLTEQLFLFGRCDTQTMVSYTGYYKVVCFSDIYHYHAFCR